MSKPPRPPQVSVRLSVEQKAALKDLCYLCKADFQSILLALIELAIDGGVSPQQIASKLSCANSQSSPTSPLIRIEARLDKIEAQLKNLYR